MGAMEEQVRNDGEEDMRGVEAFVAWCMGPGALEIRRVAGLVVAEGSGALTTAAAAITTTTTAAAGGAGGGGNTIDLSATATATALGGKGGRATETMLGGVERAEDWLAVLKKKHAKTRDGEESRWAGTLLGRDKEREGGVRIEGWEGVEGLREWGERCRGGGEGVLEVEVEGEGGVEMEMEMGMGNAGSESSSPLSEISAATAT